MMFGQRDILRTRVVSFARKLNPSEQSWDAEATARVNRVSSDAFSLDLWQS